MQQPEKSVDEKSSEMPALKVVIFVFSFLFKSRTFYVVVAAVIIFAAAIFFFIF